MSDPPRRESRIRGRPKLGVIGREVTLRPDDWQWLGAQPGGASLALRQLVDAARSSCPAISSTAHPAPSPLDALLPAGQRQAAQRALREAFGHAAIDSANRLPGRAAGLATVIRLRVQGTHYALRVDGPPSPQRDTARHYACLQIAAAAGIAPRLIYADAGAGMAISEFIRPTPAARLPARAARIRAIVQTVHRLHAAPLFPRLQGYLDHVDGLIDQCHASGILANDAVHEHVRLYAALAAGYPRHDPDLVSSHNDLNPGNVLFAAERPWFLDWKSAFAADRYVDLAAIANFYALNGYDEEMLLRIYFGVHLTDRHRARLFLMQQVNRMCHAMELLNSVAAAAPHTQLSAALLAVPRFSELRGELASLSTQAGRLRFGCVFLNEVKCNLQSPRFAEALGIVAAG